MRPCSILIPITVTFLCRVFSTNTVVSPIQSRDFFPQETEADPYPPRSKNPTPEEQSYEYAREKIMQRLATNGVELHDYGTLLRFAKQYQQLIYMPLPFVNDYISDIPVLPCENFNQSTTNLFCAA